MAPSKTACFFKEFPKNEQQSNANNILLADKIKRIAMSKILITLHKKEKILCITILSEVGMAILWKISLFEESRNGNLSSLGDRGR